MIHIEMVYNEGNKVSYTNIMNHAMNVVAGAIR